MPKTLSQKLSTQSDFLSQDSSPPIDALSKISTNQANPQSDSLFSSEETSPLFTPNSLNKVSNSNQRKVSILTTSNKFDLDLSSIQSSPTKLLTQNLSDLKLQILNLTQKFSNHQQDVKDLTGENVMLKTRIINLQENLLHICELNTQNKSMCSCSVI